MVHPDDRERLGHAIRTYLSGETREFEVEFRSRHKDGSYRWRLTRGMAVRDPAGRPIRLIGSSVDITDLKRAEEALRASEQRFRTFVDHATDAFFLQDDQLVVVDVNRQACQSLGYTRDELVGMTPLDFDPDVTPAMLEEFGRRLDTGEMLVFESRHRRKDGSVFPVEVRGRPFWEGGRRLTVALARDITEHKRAEEALRESERRFRILAEALPHMVWTAGPDGATDYYNARTTEYTGLTPEQLQGWGWRSTIHPEDLPRCLELWTRSIATGEPYEIEFRCAAPTAPSAGTSQGRWPSATIRAGSPSGSGRASTSMIRSAPRRRCGRPRRRRRRRTGPRTSSWPTSATRSAPP